MSEKVRFKYDLNVTDLQGSRVFKNPEDVLKSVSSSFGGKHILVVGDLMLDRYLWGSVERISPEAPVPVVRILRQSKSLGGAGNVAQNLAELGLRVSVAGFLGSDADGKDMRALLKQSGIEVKGLVDCEFFPTTTKTRVIGGHQQIVRLDTEDDSRVSGNESAQLLQRLNQLLNENPSVIVLSDYAKGVLSEEVCQTAIRYGRTHNIPVLADPKGRDYKKYKRAMLISPNRAELSVAVGRPVATLDALKVEGEKLRQALELDMLVVTLSEHGIALFESGRFLHVPAYAREVFDVSGAGDTAIAVIAASFAANLCEEDALNLANLSAGIVVGKVGTVPITRKDLLGAMENESVFEQKRKLCTLDDAMERVAEWRKKGERIVFTNGCFDLLHVGHIDLLEKSRREGDRLVVGINSDNSVRALKGSARPIISEKDRARVLSALTPVDLVIVFDEETPLRLINTLRPEILIKGNDYRIDQVVGAPEVQSWGGRVVLVPLVPGKSSSNIINQLEGAQKSPPLPGVI